ncbi:MAG: hypothetical protein ABI478_09390, partial [Propionivibrio sp.]
EFERADGQKQTLAILQAYVENQGSAWNFSVDYLERFLGEQMAELMAPAVLDSPLAPNPQISPNPPIAPNAPAGESPHGYFLTLMDLLGQRTGELHLAFAQPTGDPGFEPEAITALDLARWSEHLRDEAVATLDDLERRRDELPGDQREGIDRLLSLRKTLLTKISPASLAGVTAAKMRYHGDYHLGQVLRVEHDFVITDFEGEPGRTIAERHEKHSPMRDVAGMLRSFSYVAAVATNHSTTERPSDRHRAGPLAQAWEHDAATAFLTGYRNVVGNTSVVPPEGDATDRLIRFFVIEKALYELRYEMNNRPDWLAIPLFSLIRTIDGTELAHESSATTTPGGAT